MDAKVGVCHPVALFIHAKEAFVLLKELARQQVAHDMKFVFDFETELTRASQRALASVRVDELHYFRDRAAVVQGERRQAGAMRSLRPITQRKILRYEHDATWLETAGCGVVTQGNRRGTEKSHLQKATARNGVHGSKMISPNEAAT